MTARRSQRARERSRKIVLVLQVGSVEERGTRRGSELGVERTGGFAKKKKTEHLQSIAWWPQGSGYYMKAMMVVLEERWSVCIEKKVRRVLDIVDVEG